MNSNLVISYCQQILLSFLPFIVPLIFLLIVIGLTSLCVQLFITKRFIKKYLDSKVSVPDRLSKIAIRFGILEKIEVVESKRNLAFCYGVLHPKIVLSSQLISALSNKELQAVLLHESYHLKNYDPLKIILSKTLSSVFFFIPILKDLQRHYLLTKEIAADTEVIKQSGREVLMSVLSKFITARFSYLNSVATLASPDDLEKRILYLGGRQKAVSFQPSVFSISISIFMIVVLFALISTPVYAVRNKEGGFCQQLPYTPLPNAEQ